MQVDQDDLWTRHEMRHPSVPPPDNLDALLWRYMSERHFRWLVENKRLYMPRLEQLAHNDPREGTIPDAQAAWWMEQIKSAKTAEEAKQVRDNYARICWFVEQLRKDWFVSCWTKSDTENFAFWRIYGRGESVCGSCGQRIHTTGQSVAITTTFRKLESHLPAYVDVGVVKYSDYVTAGVDRYNMLDHVMNKRHFYQYESEVRAVTNLGLVSASPAAIAHIKSNMIDGSYAPPVNINSLIVEIVLHPESTESFAQEIRTLCAQHTLPAPRLSGLTS
jgi:hypothetical protein